MRRLAFCVALVVCSSGLLKPAYGEIYDFGLHTWDDETELEWLDWTETTGRSYNEVVSALSPGGQYEGYAHASLEQVNTLLGHFGIDVDRFDSSNRIPIETAQSHLGVTQYTAGGNFASAFVSDLYPPYPAAGKAVWTELITTPNSFHGVENHSAAIDDVSPHIGHALVRTRLTPEPSTLLMLAGLLLSGVGWRRLRRR